MDIKNRQLFEVFIIIFIFIFRFYSFSFFNYICIDFFYLKCTKQFNILSTFYESFVFVIVVYQKKIKKNLYLCKNNCIKLD